MEGKGVYNESAAIPAAGGALALPLLQRAARLIKLDTGDRPIVIADYGSSEGKNSLAPMRAAIAVLRTPAGLQQPIFVYHTEARQRRRGISEEARHVFPCDLRSFIGTSA
jgi:hypothetical protein